MKLLLLIGILIITLSFILITYLTVMEFIYDIRTKSMKKKR